MWLPDWLYERLPLLYVVGSALSLVVLGLSPEALVGAVPLLLAALLILARRRQTRAARRASDVHADKWRR